MPDFISPLAMSTSALIVAGLIGLLTLPFDKHREKIDPKDIGRFIIGALLIGVFRKVFLMEGLSRTSPIDASIIITVTPILVLIISVVVHIEAFTVRKVIGMLLGLGGAMLIVLMSSHHSHVHSSLVGNLLIVACAVSAAVYMVWFQKLLKKYRPLTLLRWLYCIAAIIMLPFGIKDIVHTDYGTFTHSAWAAYFFVLLLPSFVPNYLLMYALKRVTPTISSIFNYLQPVLATVIALAMRMDKLQWDTIVGAVAIFVGVFLVIGSYNKSKSIPVARIE